MINPLREWLARRHGEKAYSALSVGDYEKAFALSEKLYRLRNTAAFEVRGRALWGLGDRKQAIHILEEGLQKAPGVFVLWDYLASYYSDEGWYDQAIEAYAKALECEGAERTATLYNIALVHQRSGRNDKCAEVLTNLDMRGHVIENIATSTLAHALMESGEVPRALALVMKRMSETDPNEPHYYWLLTEKAWGEWKLGLNDRALADAYQAVEQNKHATRASWLIREISGVRSPTARKFLLHVRGDPPPGPDGRVGPPFQHRWYVVAENPEEGMESVKTHLPPFMRDRVRLGQTDDLGGAEDHPTGVYELVEGDGREVPLDLTYWPKS